MKNESLEVINNQKEFDKLYQENKLIIDDVVNIYKALLFNLKEYCLTDKKNKLDIINSDITELVNRIKVIKSNNKKSVLISGLIGAFFIDGEGWLNHRPDDDPKTMVLSKKEALDVYQTLLDNSSGMFNEITYFNADEEYKDHNMKMDIMNMSSEEGKIVVDSVEKMNQEFNKYKQSLNKVDVGDVETNNQKGNTMNNNTTQQVENEIAADVNEHLNSSLNQEKVNKVYEENNKHYNLEKDTPKQKVNETKTSSEKLIKDKETDEAKTNDKDKEADETTTNEKDKSTTSNSSNTINYKTRRSLNITDLVITGVGLLAVGGGLYYGYKYFFNNETPTDKIVTMDEEETAAISMLTDDF